MNHFSKTDPETIDDILNKGSLAGILKKAKLLEQLNITLGRYISTSLSSHCQVMNYKNSIVVIGVDSATWLTKLRFEESNLLHALQNDRDTPNVLGIEYKILR